MSNTKRVVARQKLADDQSPPPDAAIVAATILLRRALDAAAVTLAETLRPGFVLIIVIPQEAWGQSVRAAWRAMIHELSAGEPWPDGRIWAGDFKSIGLIGPPPAAAVRDRPLRATARRGRGGGEGKTQLTPRTRRQHARHPHALQVQVARDRCGSHPI